MKKIVAALASAMLVTTVFAQTAAPATDAGKAQLKANSESQRSTGHGQQEEGRSTGDAVKAQASANEDKASAQADADKKAAKVAKATTPEEASDARGDAAKAQTKANKKKHDCSGQGRQEEARCRRRMPTWRKRRPTRKKSRLKATLTRRPPMRRSTLQRSNGVSVTRIAHIELLMLASQSELTDLPFLGDLRDSPFFQRRWSLANTALSQRVEIEWLGQQRDVSHIVVDLRRDVQRRSPTRTPRASSAATASPRARVRCPTCRACARR